MTSGVKGSKGSVCRKCGSGEVVARHLCGLCYKRAYNSGELTVRSYAPRQKHIIGGVGNKAKDGRSKHYLYTTWSQMINRCYNPNATGYQHYGGRGITVCARWRRDFWLFVKDMGERPHGYTLDRTDVNGNYTPENCEWQPWSVQSKNKRRPRRKVSA